MFWKPPVKASTGGDAAAPARGEARTDKQRSPDTKSRKGVASGVVVSDPLPVFFEQKQPLPSERKWRGWSLDMPPEYYFCPSCNVQLDLKGKGTHLQECPCERIAIRWSCPSCGTDPGKSHESWCPRFDYRYNPYDATAYNVEDFLVRCGFKKQTIYGKGCPPSRDPRKRVERFRTFSQLRAAGQRIEEPTMFPTLSEPERKLLKAKPVPELEELDDDLLPF